MEDLNVVTLVCRLTRDVELRSTGSGTSVASLRVAFSSSVKDDSGNWVKRSNYVDITVWGQQGETCARYLSKGRQIAVRGRLQWREWQTQEGQKRQAVDIVADRVQFLGDGKGGDDSGGGGSSLDQQRDGEPVGAGAGAGVPDDIPF